MEVRIKESVTITVDNTDRIIRHGTVAVVRGRMFFFYDSTKTASIGFDRETVFENKQMFQVSNIMEKPSIDVLELNEFLKKNKPVGVTDKDWEKFCGQIIAHKQ